MYQIVKNAVLEIECVLHRSNVTRTHEKRFREANSLVYYLKGGHRFIFGQEELSAGQGDVVILPYGACYQNITQHPETEYYQIEFSLLKEGMPTALCDKPMIFSCSRDLQTLFSGVYAHYLRSSPAHRLLCLAGLLEILGTISVSQEWSAQKTDGAKAITPVVEHINNCYYMNTSIEELAKKAFVSVSFLEKNFHKCFGMSPTAYRNRVRVEKAKQLLSEEYTIEEAARMVGFSDRYYFTKTFKKAAGVTPGEFVRMYHI